jgi:maltooligosyltrehalose trehalohydrolase
MLYAIFDFITHISEEFVASVDTLKNQLNRLMYLIGSDATDPRLIRSPEVGGYNRCPVERHFITPARIADREYTGYFRLGRIEIWSCFSRRVRLSASTLLIKSLHGSHLKIFQPNALLFLPQNHDQVGNRMLGERLSQLVSRRGPGLAAVLSCFPFIPLIFMGEEYAEMPISIFHDHPNRHLLRLYAQGASRVCCLRTEEN